MSFFLFAIRLTFVILQGANIYKFKKIILKFFFISVALTWNDIHFVLSKGNNSILEKCQKLKILESSWKLANDLNSVLCVSINKASDLKFVTFYIPSTTFYALFIDKWRQFC
jgi:hypothetical protein